MPSDEQGPTTQEFEEHRDATHRGRRGSDQILEGWTWGRVIKIATAISLVGGIVVGIVSFAAAAIVTRPDLNRVDAKLATVQIRASLRFRRIEMRQDDAEQVHRLLIPMARLQCLQMEKWQSSTLAFAAGLPCDSLLRRLR